MPDATKQKKPLTALAVKNLMTVGMHSDPGAPGLYLQVKSPTKRSWVFRYKLDGKSHLMGLGSVQDVSLAEARDEAEAARKLARKGIDPIEDRDRRREEEKAARTQSLFRDVAEAYMAAHSPTWRNPKHRQQWKNTLLTYVYDVIGDVSVASVTIDHVMQILEPIWQVKPETAGRVRGRIETVLDYAASRGWRTADNPARWKGHLSTILPAKTKVRKIEHHPALPWDEAHAFMKALAAQPGNAALAFQFTILTAARTEEVIGATWAEIDLPQKLWTVPATRMKAGREHRVPLSEPALKLLTALPHRRGPLFRGGKDGEGLSNMSMLMLLRRMKRSDLTVHGFRSTFRDWVAEATDYSSEVAEAALAHVVGDKVEAAYRRGDLFSKRRRLMEDWATFCTAQPTSSPEAVGTALAG